MTETDLTTREPTEAERISAHLRVLSRDPFKAVLRTFIENAPSAEALSDLAERYPEKWAQALSYMAHLAGYHDKMQVDHEHLHLHRIVEMSDMELMKLHQELQRKLQGDGAKVVGEGIGLEVKGGEGAA